MDALTGHFAPGERPRPEEALREHQAVVAGLRWLGFDVVALPVEGHADGCFVEDHAVVIGDAALLCRTGAPSRRAEARSVHEAVAARVRRLTVMEEGKLDGGDVLVAGETILVGQGARSDALGLAAVRRAFPEHRVLPVQVPAGSLHLKCVCSAPGGVVLSAIDLPVPHRRVPAAQSYAANAVGLGDRVLIAEGYPEVAGLFADREVRTVATPQLRIADGSLTCLSIRLD